MAHIEHAADDAGDGGGDADGGRQGGQADHGQAEDRAGSRDGAEQEADPVERRWRCRLDLRQVDARKNIADDADRQVDQKDPVPGEIGGNEAAERRAGKRPHQRGDGEQRHGRDQFGARCAAHQNEARHRRHHRPAHALKEACDHEGQQAAGHRAEDGACDEHQDGKTEDALGPEPVRHPPAQGNEGRKRHHVGGERELERDRPHAEIGGDGRQRGGDDGGIHLLHEERDGKDKRNDTVHRHVACEVPGGPGGQGCGLAYAAASRNIRQYLRLVLRSVKLRAAAFGHHKRVIGRDRNV